MSFGPSVPLGDSPVFDFTTGDGASIAAAADSTPTCKVFAGTNDTAIHSPTVTARSGDTAGGYRVTVVATTANSFAVGGFYTVKAYATIGGVTAQPLIVAMFQVGPPQFRFTVVANGGNTASTFKTDRTESTNDFWKRALAKACSGTLAGQQDKISAYDGTTKFVTLSSGLTAAPTAGDVFELVTD